MSPDLKIIFALTQILGLHCAIGKTENFVPERSKENRLTSLDTCCLLGFSF